jgi:predicted DNA-binding transcriptional regulator YafY
LARPREKWHRNGRYRPLFRILKVFVALIRSRFGLTFRELQEEAGCPRRTLYRYLEVLQEAGVRIRMERRLTGEIVRRFEHVDGAQVRIVG